MDLNEYLKEYRALTLDIMDIASKSGNIAPLIKEREDILKFLNSGEFEKEEIKKAAELLKLFELEKEMNVIVKKEINVVKGNIEKLKKHRKASVSYNNINSGFTTFNKFI